jgi:hypothetical protein
MVGVSPRGGSGLLLAGASAYALGSGMATSRSTSATSSSGQLSSRCSTSGCGCDGCSCCFCCHCCYCGSSRSVRSSGCFSSSPSSCKVSTTSFTFLTSACPASWADVLASPTSMVSGVLVVDLGSCPPPLDPLSLVAPRAALTCSGP